MRDAIAWSYDLLTSEEQALFRRLGVFVGGFRLSAAEVIGGCEELTDLCAVVDEVSSLIEQSLLLPVAPFTDEPRYQMLETVREFALERLEEQGETGEARRQHALYFLRYAEDTEPELYGPEQGLWLDRLEAEHPNLRTALAWLTAHDPERALRLCAALLRFWPIRGHLSEGRDWLERALAAEATARSCAPPAATAAGEAAASGRAKALVALAWVLYWQSDFTSGASIAEEAQDLFQQLGDRRGNANAIRVLGHTIVGLGQEASPADHGKFARARAVLDEQLAIWQELDEPHGIATAHHNLGFLAVDEGDVTLAETHLGEAIRLFDALGDRWSAALVLVYLAHVDTRRGETAQAAPRLAQALAVFVELGDRWKVSYVLDAVASLLVVTGQTETAARLLGAAAALLEADGIRHFRTHAAGDERPTAAVRAKLGEDALESCWNAGRGLTLDEIAREGREALAAVREARKWSPTTDARVGGVTLTPREHEVLQQLAQGLSDRDIATALAISERTAGNHVLHILQKLDVESRTAAAVFALRHGFS